MPRSRQFQPGNYLDRITNHVERLKRLNPAVQVEREQALSASRQLLGMLALYSRKLNDVMATPVAGISDNVS